MTEVVHSEMGGIHVSFLFRMIHKFYWALTVRHSLDVQIVWNTSFQQYNFISIGTELAVWMA